MICMYIDNIINCESIYVTYRTPVTMNMTNPVICDDVSYPLFDD